MPPVKPHQTPVQLHPPCIRTSPDDGLVYFGLKLKPASAFLCRGSESLPLKIRSVAARLYAGLLLTVVVLSFTGCGQVLYKAPQNNFAGRPIPPSGLLQRVLATYSANGISGGAVILDGLRDLRGNVQNTIQQYPVNGFSGGSANIIFNYPEQTTGYIYSASNGTVSTVNYSKESVTGTAASFIANPGSVAASPDGTRFVAAIEAGGVLMISDKNGTFPMNLPNVYKVAINTGNTVILGMVRNSNTLYRIVKLDATSNPVTPPGAVDCQPLILPIYCVVPVPGTFDRPSDVSFSVDGSTAYVLNCGPECGGTAASITFLQEGALTINVIPKVNPLDPAAPSPAQVLPVANPVPIPGGVTTVLSDGTTLYIAGQLLLANGLFTGTLSTLNLNTYKVTGNYSISDGHHSKMLFADDNTLWIGSQQCANGQRAALAAQQLAAHQSTTQAANYNCLTEVTLSGATPTVNIFPAVTQVPSGATATPVMVGYPNTDQNAYYYGNLTGLCWVQLYHKVFTAYGGQVHAFYTGGKIVDQNDPGVGTTPAVGTEINNANFTVQGTVLDVAYMDAITNSAN